jgi:23S rRNA pseudouridine1911/1915/1917 synthase
MPAIQSSRSTTLIVPSEAIGQRLDRWLSTILPERSRSEIQRWIKEGRVTVDNTMVRASLRLEDGQTVLIQIPIAREETPVTATDLPLNILYEDDNLLVVDKVAGMVVHPAPGHLNGTLVNAILHHCPEIEGVGGKRRPGLVHRLDKETSGVIAIAKNDRTHRSLQAQFKSRTVYKEYLALVEGRMEPRQGRINAPMGRHPVDRKRQAILPPDPITGESPGRDAVTEYYTLREYGIELPRSQGYGQFTLLRVILHTGRTHQIRVHFAWRKHPIVGDTVYGFRRQRIPIDRQFLHAHKLRLRVPGKDGQEGEERTFVAPLPPDLIDVLNRLEE